MGAVSVPLFPMRVFILKIIKMRKVVSHVVVKTQSLLQPFSFSKNWGRRIKVNASEHS